MCAIHLGGRSIRIAAVRLEQPDGRIAVIQYGQGLGIGSCPAPAVRNRDRKRQVTCSRKLFAGGKGRRGIGHAVQGRAVRGDGTSVGACCCNGYRQLAQRFDKRSDPAGHGRDGILHRHRGDGRSHRCRDIQCNRTCAGACQRTAVVALTGDGTGAVGGVGDLRGQRQRGCPVDGRADIRRYGAAGIAEGIKQRVRGGGTDPVGVDCDSAAHVDGRCRCGWLGYSLLIGDGDRDRRPLQVVVGISLA